MIKIAIIDDDSEFVKRAAKIVGSVVSACQVEYTLTSYLDGMKFLDEQKKYDLLILDIDMPQISGFKLIEKLNESPDIRGYKAVIYISNYSDLVFESIKYAPLRFVRKNLFDTELPEAINAFLSKYTDENEIFFFTDRDTGKDVKIKLVDIMLFEAFGHDMELLINDGTKYCVKRKKNKDITLNVLEEKYRSKGFIRSHRSYLVNYRYVYTIHENKVILNGDYTALIASRNIKDFKLKYQKFVMKEQV